MAAPSRFGSFAELVEHWAGERPDALAVADAEQRLSWRELAEATGRLAAALTELGAAAGDRLAIQAPTSVDFVLTYLAALRAGLVVVPINPAYTRPELEYILTDSGASLLVTGSVSTIEAATELLALHPGLRILVTGRGGTDELPALRALLQGSTTIAPGPGRTGADLAVLLYTSGTSGHPKGAMLPVRALLANLHQVAQLQPPVAGPQDVVFLPLPLFHVFGLNAGLGMALYVGASLLLVDRFDAAGTLAAMAAAHATVVVGAPLEYARWAEQDGLAEGFAHVRIALSGSAPLPTGLVARYAAAGITLFEGYGLTEAAPVVTLNLVADGAGGWAEPKAGSVGRPLPEVQVRLMDADREPAEAGDLGFVEVRGENLFTGYWPDGAGGPDPDGWFATGDLAVTDDDGDLYLVGRRSDLVLVNGFNVYPAEVEAVFGRLAGVREVAVLGRPDAAGEDVLVAYVVPEPGHQLDPEALVAEAAGSLARFKLPRRVIEVDALPHTATGKVMKWRLTDGG
ncbi:MAG TPA: AMP-binding protein [Jatrophihabitans sp.]|nr:AMP-binding protein [Jatrophihabitans sp.]